MSVWLDQCLREIGVAMGSTITVSGVFDEIVLCDVAPVLCLQPCAGNPSAESRTDRTQCDARIA